MLSYYPECSIGEAVEPVSRAVEPQPGTIYRQIGVRLWGEGAYERAPLDGKDTKYANLYSTQANDIIVNKIWARNGSVAVVTPELSGCVASSEFPMFCPIQGKLDPAWFHWITKTHWFWEKCDYQSRGTSGKNRIRPEKFLSITIPLPPIDEQRRVVRRIERANEKLQLVNDIKAKADKELPILWSSILSEAFKNSDSSHIKAESGKLLLEAQKEKYKNFQKTKHNNAFPHNPTLYEEGMFDIPESWVWTDLGSILTHLIDCVNDTPDFSPEDTGLLGLKTQNIRPYQLVLKEKWFMFEEDFHRWNRRIYPSSGDIILTREAPVGNSCILPSGFNICLTQRLLLLRCDEDFICNRYLLHFINSPFFKAQYLDKSRGLTTPHIRVQDAPYFLIPLPPLSEQVKIADSLDEQLSKINEINRLNTQIDKKYSVVLPSILNKAFQGDL